LKNDCRRLSQDGFGSGAFGPGCLRWIGGLAGFEAVAGGDHVVVVALVELSAPGATGLGGFEAAVGAFDAYVGDAVGEVGAEEGVLAGAGGGDASAGDRAGPFEGGVEARGGERGIGVTALEVVALDRVTGCHDEQGEDKAEQGDANALVLPIRDKVRPG